MDTAEKSTIIKDFSLFESLTDQELTSIAQHAKQIVFPPHTTIISQEKPGEGVYVIYKGLIRVFMFSKEGRVIPIKIKSNPYILGVMDAINNERTSTIETIRETHTLLIPRESFKKILLENAHLTFSVLQMVTKKLRETNMQTEYYFSSTLLDRTLHILKELAPFFSENTITLSQEEIADIVGATRARVTEVLNELSNQKLVSLSQRKILVL